MTEKIFLSYAHQDRAIADQAEKHLREHGLVISDMVILDPQKEIRAGDNIREVIRSQMMAASKVVIITSPNSAQSQWVNYEAGMASALGKPIIVIGSRGMEESTLLKTLGVVRSIEIDDAGLTRRSRGRRGKRRAP